MALVSSLRRELEKSRLALERAADVEVEDVERYLDLLDQPSGPTMNGINDSRFREQADGQDSGVLGDSVLGDADSETEVLADNGANGKGDTALRLALSQPGGVSARSAERTKERHRHLETALSTIAVRRKISNGPLCADSLPVVISSRSQHSSFYTISSFGRRARYNWQTHPLDRYRHLASRTYSHHRTNR